uniref:Uncharacterized protein n=1 Tax=Cajanus cajan TaxID=3821 RepID=A0A151QQ74_CAJCA|nr:hypothetical protein KK1_046882 [Cajanus cajan]
MPKNKMNAIKVLIIIMLMTGFVQANFDPPMKHSKCYNICCIKCTFKYFFNKRKLVECFKCCRVKCHEYANDATYDCITSCAKTKSIDNNIGNHSLASLFGFVTILHSV